MVEVVPFEGGAPEFIKAIGIPFGWSPKPEDIEAATPLIEPERALVARDGGAIIGTAGIFTMQLGVPGGVDLPMAGVTMVGVHPTHRRRGILRRMMRAQLDAIHERGEPLAGLWASEGAIYQRFGYGWATSGAGFEVERGRTAYRNEHTPAGSFRLIDPDEAKRAFPPLFEAVRGTRPGSYARADAWWGAELLYDPEHDRRDASPQQLVLYEVEGRPAGYAAYRLHPDWDDRGPKTALEVREAIARDAEATRSLWRYLFDVDLVATIRGRNQPVDHPIQLAVAEPRRLGWTVRDALWLRLVDVPAALAGRTWQGSGNLVLQVADEFCAWNAGRWALEVTDGAATVRPADAHADLELTVDDLGAVYLGGWRAGDLARAGRLVEHTTGAAGRFDALLHADVAPWCPQVF